MTELILFYVFGGVALIFAAMVVTLRNPVTSCLSLVVSFFSIAGIFVLLHAPFLAVMQVLIYTGAILVLFLYVTMLLNVGSPSPKIQLGKLTRSLAILLMSVLLLSGMAAFVDLPEEAYGVLPSDFGSVAHIGELLLRPNILLFEIVSAVLLVAIVGVVVLAMHKAETETRKNS